ncbi:MAG: cold shock domain-containing protein [Anaeromicrobium sp.]|jgi:CspA family cold shock protein|uniref:cold-shock protein n=1 Tax=Anaeromicrobium sp. TaxID=1929132 RepID=UPI0025FD4A61|nr:cold shock domain-containing protein [Anaeromicrobium sp.]MCT4593912.1 cold shock domain-containing protein [Anaeromicrobium sp.]
MKGTVKLYSLVKGEGIIIGEDSKEYKVKMAGIKGTGMRKLSEGQRVEFTVKESHKGLGAVDVEII